MLHVEILTFGLELQSQIRPTSSLPFLFKYCSCVVIWWFVNFCWSVCIISMGQGKKRDRKDNKERRKTQKMGGKDREETENNTTILTSHICPLPRLKPLPQIRFCNDSRWLHIFWSITSEIVRGWNELPTFLLSSAEDVQNCFANLPPS